MNSPLFSENRDYLRILFFKVNIAGKHEENEHDTSTMIRFAACFRNFGGIHKHWSDSVWNGNVRFCFDASLSTCL